MPVHPLAGKPAPRDLLINVPRLVSAYYTYHPDPAEPAHAVAFGTSGHRGTSLSHSFNEDHILAISQAICEYRASQGTTGPLFAGMDTHALSEPALMTALEVFAANGVDVMIQADGGYTPTPVISHAILTPQPRAHGGPGRRRGHHPVAQPAERRRLQVQPAQRRPGRHRRHPGDPGSRQRLDPRRPGRGQADALRAGAGGPTTTHEHDYITPYVAGLNDVHPTGRDPRRPGSRSAWTRWAARPWPSGRPSPSATG